jgi:hypothetical protein
MRKGRKGRKRKGERLSLKPVNKSVVRTDLFTGAETT